MGANIIPIKKKSGSTVLGVKMGLVVFYQPLLWSSDPASKDSKSRTAMLSNAVVGTRYLDIVRTFSNAGILGNCFSGSEVTM